MISKNIAMTHTGTQKGCKALQFGKREMELGGGGRHGTGLVPRRSLV